MEVGTAAKNIGRVLLVPIEDIVPNPNQPRKYFSEKELDGLSESIRKVGVIQPLSVRTNPHGKYDLIAGERRLRAAKKAGLKAVPCIDISTNDSGCAVISLIENIQRQNLNFFEEAQGIERLIKEYGITQERAAEYLGLAQSTLSNKLRLLAIPENVREILIKNGLSERHARALLKLASGSEILTFARTAAEKKLNVISLEALINQHLQQGKASGDKRFVVKDVRIFINTISNAVRTMRRAGIFADSIKRETEDHIEYIIKIPKSRTEKPLDFDNTGQTQVETTAAGVPTDN